MVQRYQNISLVPTIYMDQVDTKYAVDYYNLIHHPEVKPFVPSNHVPKNIQAAKKELVQQQQLEHTGKGIYWGIYTPNKLIGTCGLHSLNTLQQSMEISYEIHPDYSGQGITTTAVTHCVNYSREHLKSRIKIILAYTLTDNIASQRVAEKAGFTKHGVLKNNCFYNGVLIDRMLLIYNIKK